MMEQESAEVISGLKIFRQNDCKMTQYNLYKYIAYWVLTLSNRYLFQENITFLGEIILFQKVPYEGIWVIQIPFPTTSVQSHSKVMQFKWFFPVLVHMMKIWALQLHTLYCCLAIKKTSSRKLEGGKNYFQRKLRALCR